MASSPLRRDRRRQLPADGPLEIGRSLGELRLGIDMLDVDCLDTPHGIEERNEIRAAGNVKAAWPGTSLVPATSASYTGT